MSETTSPGPLPTRDSAGGEVALVRERAATPLRRFENINLLRAFAAIAVVVYHVIEHSKWTAFPIQGPLLTFRIGWLGVDLFFVISGFVISYSALALYEQRPRSFVRLYWRRRLARILPLYLLTLVLWIALFWPGFFRMPVWEWSSQLFSHLAFIHPSFTSTFGSIDGVNWSLGIEMQFYAAIALLTPWLARTPGWRILAYAIAIAWSWRACMVMRIGTDDPWRLFVACAQLPGTLDEFAAGIFLAKCVRRGPAGAPWQGPVALLGALALGTLCMSLYWPRAAFWAFPAMVIFWRTALAAFLFCVVMAAVRLPQFVATAPFRPLNALGEVSYGIYLWHLFAIEYFVHMLGMKQGGALVTVLTATVLIASLSWWAFEKPLLRMAARK